MQPRERVRDRSVVFKMSVRPAPHAVPRSALATVEIMVAVTLADTWAGGALPCPVAARCHGHSGLRRQPLVVRDLAPLRWMVPGLGAAELLLHVS